MLNSHVDKEEVRAANETSAKLAAQAGEPARVKKKKLTKKGKGKSHHQRMAEARVAEKNHDEGGGSEDAPGES